MSNENPPTQRPIGDPDRCSEGRSAREAAPQTRKASQWQPGPREIPCPPARCPDRRNRVGFQAASRISPYGVKRRLVRVSPVAARSLRKLLAQYGAVSVTKRSGYPARAPQIRAAAQLGIRPESFRGVSRWRTCLVPALRKRLQPAQPAREVSSASICEDDVILANV
jgi:hypothetical protein